MVWPENVEWPGIEMINGGAEFNASTVVTPNIFNNIVLALIWFKNNRHL